MMSVGADTLQYEGKAFLPNLQPPYEFGLAISSKDARWDIQSQTPDSQYRSTKQIAGSLINSSRFISFPAAL